MRKIIFCILVISIIVLYYAYAGEVKLTTYYPAPYGEYKRIATNTLGVGDNNGSGAIDSGDAPDPATNPGDVKISGNIYLPDAVGDPTVANSPKAGALKTGGGTFHTYRAAGAAGYNVFIGGAGNFSMGDAAVNNNIIGASAFNVNTTGYNNNAIGCGVLGENKTGYDNVAIGPWALTHNTSGYENIAIGTLSLQNNTSGYMNTAIGVSALYAETTGNNNNAIGYSTLYELTTGNNNTAVGKNTGRGIMTGSNNTIIGANVGSLPSGLSNNIIIADGAGNRRINVDANGNVGIGTTTPQGTLDVRGGTAAANTPGTSLNFYAQNGGAGNANGGNIILMPGAPSGTGAYGNVGIGTTTPAGILDVTSTTSAFIPPRMTTTQRDAIASPVDGMMIYNTTTNAFDTRANGAWQSMGGGGGMVSGSYTGAGASLKITLSPAFRPNLVMVINNRPCEFIKMSSMSGQTAFTQGAGIVGEGKAKYGNYVRMEDDGFTVYGNANKSGQTHYYVACP